MSNINPSVSRDETPAPQNVVLTGASSDRYYNSRSWTGRQRDRAGRLSHGCIAWMLGLPLPIIILAFLWRGCD